MDDSQKNYLSDTKNYNDTILNDEMDVVRAYIDILNEYLFHAGDKIIIQNHGYYIFVLKRGCDTIKHIFNMLSSRDPKNNGKYSMSSEFLIILPNALPADVNKIIG